MPTITLVRSPAEVFGVARYHYHRAVMLDAHCHPSYWQAIFIVDGAGVFLTNSGAVPHTSPPTMPPAMALEWLRAALV